MKIIRRPRTVRFTTLSNDLIEDSRLSFKARGLLVYLLSRPDGWHTDAHRIAHGSPDGRSAILSGLKELEVAGYLKRTRTQDDRGRWSTAAEIFDEPTGVRFSDVGSPDAGLPNSGSPAAGSPNAGPPQSKSKTETKDGNQSLVAGVVDQSADRNAHDPITETIIKAIYARTGRAIDVLWAGRIRAHITASGRQADPGPAYVEAAIGREPDAARRFLEHDPPPVAWCAQCSPSRRVEDPVTGADLGPCPTCHPSLRKASR
jgi:hypothetical protein